MELFMQSSPESHAEEAPLEFHFAAATFHVAHLAEVLASIAAVSRHALVVFSRHGITFFAEHNHIMNAQVFVGESLFSAFEYRWTRGGVEETACVPKNVQVGIDVQMLNEAFTAAAATVSAGTRPKSGGGFGYGSNGRGGENSGNSGNGAVSRNSTSENVSCYIQYRGDGHPLLVEFEDRLMSEQIEFATFHLEIDYPYGEENLESQEFSVADNVSADTAALTLDRTALRYEVILKSDILANLLQDLQNLNTEDVHISVSNVPVNPHLSHGGKAGMPYQLHFVSRGAIGYSKLTYPNARSLLQNLEVYTGQGPEPVPTTDTVVSTLGFSPFIKIFKAVKLSSTCKIMKDLHGVLSIQLLCKLASAKRYPGTLITFHVLEQSDVAGAGHVSTAEIEGLFDDQVYREVMEYEAVNDAPDEHTQHTEEPELLLANEPFSYASFKRTANDHDSPSKRSRGQDSEPNIGLAAPEFPLFL